MEPTLALKSRSSCLCLLRARSAVKVYFENLSAEVSALFLEGTVIT
jgi:hypothetical protein